MDPIQLQSCPNGCELQTGNNVCKVSPTTTPIEQTRIPWERRLPPLPFLWFLNLKTAPTTTPIEQTLILSTHSLRCGQSLFSEHLKTELAMQMDGNLVLYKLRENKKRGDAVWETGTSKLMVKAIEAMVLESGDLVLLDVNGEKVWKLGTAGMKYAGSDLLVLDAGYICLAINATCLWKSTD
ncbi:hypothetical protein BV898_01224 [Hypsibius exemplaris]|nr:hypothetical protein BV898_01224 [Hypsibius exemplaris]